MTPRTPTPLRLGHRGAVTAEFALTMPSVVLVVMAGLIGLTGGARLVSMQDAAADAARLLARGESTERVIAFVESVVPGADLGFRRTDDLVCVDLRRSIGPGVLSGLTLTARGCGLDGGR